MQLSKVPNSPAVLSFDKEVGTRSVDREVLFRSPVLTHTLSLDIDGAQQTSTVCAPSGFVGAWLDYINASEPDQDSSKGIQQGTDSLLLSLRVRSVSFVLRVPLHGLHNSKIVILAAEHARSLVLLRGHMSLM